MTQYHANRREDRRKRFLARRAGGLALSLGMLPLLGGCITVKAPDKPIEINLNVKVQQEVVVRLQKDAQDLIKNNPELFPQ
ncbi:MAG: YnbE family lipoprotein [Rhodospirillaceae bacterium]|nr:YnbE family lipoprotein [Rhodospirillaceae bacterium]